MASRIEGATFPLDPVRPAPLEGLLAVLDVKDGLWGTQLHVHILHGEIRQARVDGTL